jgi:hypothetical protein
MKFVIPIVSFCLLAATAASAQSGSTHLAAQEKIAVAASDKAHPPQLSGTIVDTSGAVIAGATLQVRSLNSTVLLTTQSDRNGAFIISGLAAGNYRLVVSNPGFETKEAPITIGTTEALALLRISLAVGAVSTTINVQGREDDLIGIAYSGTQGTVGATELEDRPILRSGEVLETLPGLIVTQHAGGGKANQYFLRGFNLDHGTDFANFLDDMPLNLPSHAHGEGYSDMNIVIPEFVRRVNFEKGPYYANVGNFGAAGSAHMEFFKTLPQNFLKVEGGMYGYGRTVFGISRKLGLGNLLYGGEVYHDNGPWSTHEDNYYKSNGLVTYSQGGDTHGFSITAHSYRGTWHSSDQIPVNAIPLVGYFGALNPTDGGESQRYSLQGEWHRQAANSQTKIAAYGFYYDLNLFSDFTYYLDDLNKGDQFEQQDRRWVAGLDAHHTIFGQWFGRKVENTIGLQVRNDWVHNGLFRTEDRVRTDKDDSNACNDEPALYGVPVLECASSTNQNAVGAILPADTDLNQFTDTLVGSYAETKVQWTDKFRSVLGLRGDDASYMVASLTPTYISNIPSLSSTPVNFALLNSGSATKFLPQPKVSLIFGPWSKTEFYTQGGFSYHSNDARGTTQHEEPISPDNPFPTSSTPIPPLVQLKGGEFGVRTSAVPHLESTLSLWYLRSNSELQQDGDTGGTVASEQSSNRYGVESANYYTPTDHVAFDLDIADSRAQFTQIDPADAAFISPNSTNGLSYPEQRPGGKHVPEAVGTVISSGTTLHDYKGFTSTLRLRYFGPRDLTSDGINRSESTLSINAGVGYRIAERWRISVDLLNMLNRRNDDITYAYVSRITPTATPAFTNVFHPAEPFQVRFWLERTF